MELGGDVGEGDAGVGEGDLAEARLDHVVAQPGGCGHGGGGGGGGVDMW